MTRYHATSSGKVPFTSEEEAARDAEEAKVAADADDRKAKEVRSERTERLATSDWMAIRASEGGTAVPSDWATYRQALRDVPEQGGFPNTITWPTEPS